MTGAAKAKTAAGRGLGRDLLAALLLAACVWLMTQAALHGARQFLPPEANLRLSPRSPQVLSDAAEAAQLDGQGQVATDLALRSLAIAPFDARTLRVLGMATAATDEERADNLITLAGNWSMRDDPAHAWLLLRRANQGNLASALAHGDVLLRRRTDLYEAIFPVFDLFAADPDGLALLARRLATNPPWRIVYFMHVKTPALLAQGQKLAEMLKGSAAPPSAAELSELYRGLADQGRYGDLRTFYLRMAGPAAPMLRDGDFPLRGQPPPLGWTFAEAPGLDAQVAPDPDGGPDATLLDVRHDGFTPGVVAHQLLILPPGSWRLSGKVRWRTPAPAQPPTWTIVCLESASAPLMTTSPVAAAGSWGLFSQGFVVPTGCGAQSLRLTVEAGERRQDVEAEFDNFQVLSQ